MITVVPLPSCPVCRNGSPACDTCRQGRASRLRDAAERVQGLAARARENAEPEAADLYVARADRMVDRAREIEAVVAEPVE